MKIKTSTTTYPEKGRREKRSRIVEVEIKEPQERAPKKELPKSRDISIPVGSIILGIGLIVAGIFYSK